jgi:hypothetical protein
VTALGEASALTRAQVFGFEWGFLDEISRWAIGVTALVAIVGALVSGSAGFAVACVLASAIDLVMVEFSVRRARRELDLGRIDSVAPIVMLAGRLLVKAGVLVLALGAQNTAVFAGAVAGVVIFDVTLAFGGSLIAIGRGMRPGERGDDHA